MEEMKFVENPEVNIEVIKIVERLKEGIASNFHPKSIILSGSFGKGEATVIENGGCLRFLSDCEVIIIPDKHIFNRGKIKQFSENFYEWTGLKVSISGVVLSIYLLFPFLNRKLKPTMENYDLKYGSKVIYGKNYLERIPIFKPDDIPLWEGIRLLFNRMAEALEYFSPENPNEEMVFWTDKIMLACQDALLLSLGESHYSYRIRNEMFQKFFPKHFCELEDELPNFLDSTIEATERKLNGTINVKDPVEYWFDAAKICNLVFRYVIKKDMGIEFKDYLEFQEKYRGHQEIRTYSRGFLYHPLYQNLRSAVKMWVSEDKIPKIKLIRKSKAPLAHVIYSIIPLLYFALSESDNPDEILVRKAGNIISLFLGKNVSKNPNPLEEWRYTTEKTISLWRVMCY